MKKNQRPLFETIAKVGRLSEEALETMEVLEEHISSHARAQSTFNLLNDLLKELKVLAGNSHDAICVNPTMKLLNGKAMTKSEFFFLKLSSLVSLATCSP